MLTGSDPMPTALRLPTPFDPNTSFEGRKHDHRVTLEQAQWSKPKGRGRRRNRRRKKKNKMERQRSVGTAGSSIEKCDRWCLSGFREALGNNSTCSTSAYPLATVTWSVKLVTACVVQQHHHKERFDERDEAWFCHKVFLS